MDWNTHPIHSLKHVVAHNYIDTQQATVDFKVYQRPHSASDADPQNRPGYYERKTVTTPVAQVLNMSCIEDLIEHCGSRYYEDISMGNKISNILGSLNPNHLVSAYYPQMDFQVQGKVAKEGDVTNMPFTVHSEILEQAECDLSIFFSGRSFHGYGTRLLTHEQWVMYMGRMLLLNNPTRADVVDPRWIGKSLVVGQSYLRMTAACDQYKQVPEFRYNIIREQQVLAGSEF